MLKMNIKKIIFFTIALICLIGLIKYGTIKKYGLQDGTETQNWSEKRTGNHFEAHFSYFDGEYDLPIYLKRGQTITVYEKWDTQTVKEPKWDAGIGSGWRDPDDQTFFWNSDSCDGTGCVSFTAEKTGNYVLQLLSWDQGGSVQVDWTIK
jgi:hypothetical protein